MKKLIISAEFEYDDIIAHSGDEDQEAKKWFLDLLLNERLIVHSNEIGDKIGHLKVLVINEKNPPGKENEKKIIERKDIDELVYEQHKSICKYKKEHVEIEGVLYIKQLTWYESCTKDYLDLYKIGGFNSSNKRLFMCKCFNATEFQVYNEGYEGVAKCLKCGNEIVIHEG